MLLYDSSIVLEWVGGDTVFVCYDSGDPLFYFLYQIYFFRAVGSECHGVFLFVNSFQYGSFYWWSVWYVILVLIVILIYYFCACG